MTPLGHDHEELSRPQPAMVHPQDAALEAIAHAREAALMARTATEQLLELAQHRDRPAEVRTVTLTPGQPIINDRHRNAYKSIGVWNPGGTLNPENATVYVGIGGNSARAGASTPPVPAGSMIVLPLSDIDIEIGADPAQLGTGNATVFLFFYDSVQSLGLYQVAEGKTTGEVVAIGQNVPAGGTITRDIDVASLRTLVIAHRVAGASALGDANSWGIPYAPDGTLPVANAIATQQAITQLSGANAVRTLNMDVSPFRKVRATFQNANAAALNVDAYWWGS